MCTVIITGCAKTSTHAVVPNKVDWVIESACKPITLLGGIRGKLSLLGELILERWLASKGCGDVLAFSRVANYHHIVYALLCSLNRMTV